MKHHPGLLATLAAALLLPGLSLAQEGKTQVAPAADAAAAEAAETKASPGADKSSRQEKKAARAAAKGARNERQCSMPTSSRLQKKGDECEQATDNTRWHSRGELDSTGQSSTADALRQLDPSVH